MNEGLQKGSGVLWMLAAWCLVWFSGCMTGGKVQYCFLLWCGDAGRWFLLPWTASLFPSSVSAHWSCSCKVCVQRKKGSVIHYAWHIEYVLYSLLPSYCPNVLIPNQNSDSELLGRVL